MEDSMEEKKQWRVTKQRRKKRNGNIDANA